MHLFSLYTIIGLNKVSKDEEGTVLEVSDPKYLIGDDFWDGIEYAAIDFSLSETDKNKTDFSDALKIDIPEETKVAREFTWNNDGTLSVLAVGNSFSADALEYVYQIAKSAGVEKVIIGNLFYSGCRISQHFSFWNKKSEVYDYYLNTNGTWKVTSGTSFEAAFGEYDWDFISFQESAQELQTKESNYNKLGKLIAMAKERCPDAKFVYHMPWSNPHANYQMKTEKMYNDCMTALRKIIEDYGFDEIITTGTAIQNARTSSIDNDSLLRDGWHLSLGIGRYIASLTFFAQITGISVKDIDFVPSGISDAEKLIAVESAENARKNPRIITQSKFKG